MNSQIDELLASQKRAREEKKRLANEIRNAKRRRQHLTKRARLLSTEDLLTVVALRQAAQGALEGTAATPEGSDERVASEHSEPETQPADDEAANGSAEVILQDAEREHQQE